MKLENCSFDEIFFSETKFLYFPQLWKYEQFSIDQFFEKSKQRKIVMYFDKIFKG